MFGVLVAYVKLGDLVTINLGTGVFALFALTFVMVWADGALDHEAVWDALDRSTACRPGETAGAVAGRRPIGCEACGLVSVPAHRRCALPALRFAAASRASRTAWRAPGRW